VGAPIGKHRVVSTDVVESPVSRRPPSDAIIFTRALRKVYPGGLEAVQSLDMEIRRGEIYGLLGPNGAGKSTTIGMLTTRVAPTSGEAYVGGVDVIRRPALAKQVIGVMPQSNTLDRQLTVFENLEFHGRYFGMTPKAARARAQEMLQLVRLTDRATAPVLALSGGMAQRLMVARAILHRPHVVFLDEPTAGLDPQSRLALWDILHGLHDDGQTILLTTHHMEEADRLCDRVAIMDHGRILALDSPKVLKESTGAARVARITANGDLEALAERLLSGFGAGATARVVDGIVHVSTTESDSLLPRVVAAADAVGATLTDLSVAEPSLETVFIHLTGRDLRE
jgi:ABC-2 type transport system ATP-binding protein